MLGVVEYLLDTRGKQGLNYLQVNEIHEVSTIQNDVTVHVGLVLYISINLYN